MLLYKNLNKLIVLNKRRVDTNHSNSKTSTKKNKNAKVTN